MQKTFKYNNGDITIIWKPDACIHSTHCWKGLREVFDPTRRPWIEPQAATSERIIEQIKKCPSGALSFIMNNEMSTEDIAASVPPGNIIECSPNGPLLVKGNVLVKKSDGTEETKSGTVALCRCGASQNKPYCDGSHRKINFKG